MSTALYQSSGAKSNRSDKLKLKAFMESTEYSSYVEVSVTYNIIKETETNYTAPGTRYGLLVEGFSVNSNGEITSRGSILDWVVLPQLTDGSQNGTATFSVSKSTTAKYYSGVTFLINDTPYSTTFSSDSTYLWTGQQGSSVQNLPDNFATTTLSIPAGAGQCSAPTVVNSSLSLQKPGDYVVISWSGASAGENSPISGYYVYYRVDAAPTIYTYTERISISTTDTSSSIGFLVPASASRGSTYYFKIVTRSSAGSSSNSNISSATASFKINTLPEKPEVIPSKTIVASSGGNVTFTLSGTDADRQSLKFFYSTSENGSKIEINSGDSIAVSKEETYYFYSFDGLEYSSTYTPITISLNTKPLVSVTTEGIGTKYTSELLDSSYNNFYTQVTGTIDLNGTNSDSIIWYGRYIDIPSDGIINWDKPSTEIIELEENNTTTTTFDLSLNSVFKTLNNKIYQIGAKYYDGIEYSDIAWGATNFVIAPSPIIGDFINQYGTTNVQYSTPNHFYNNASIIASKDDSIISITASITNNAKVGILSDTIESYKKNGYFKINITNTNPNTIYELTFNINRVIGGATKTFRIISSGLPYKDEINNIFFSSSDISNQTTILKPYTDNSNFIITLYNFFETTNFSSVNKNYNGSSLEGCMSFSLSKGEKILNFSPTYSSSSDSSIYFTYNKNFYKNELLLGNNPLELDLESINSINLNITFTDVFNQSYTITKNNYLTLDFREPFINDDGFYIEVFRNDLSVIDNIQEGDIIKFNLNWQSYNSQVATIESYIYRSSSVVSDLTNVTWEKFQDNLNYIWNINISETTPTNLIRSGTGVHSYTVRQINKSNYVYFKIITTINGQSKTYYTTDYSITQRHIPAQNASFLKLNYNTEDQNNPKIIYAHTPFDGGGGNTPSDSNDVNSGIQKLEIGIQYSIDFESDSSIKKYISTTGEASDEFVALITRNTESDIKSELSDTTEHIQAFIPTDWSYYNIRLVIKTTIDSTIKIGYSEETTIYNITPTISYRKNQLGINVMPENFDIIDGFENSTDNIKNNGVVIIQSSSNKDNIYFISPNHKIKLNIATGRLDGILIDEGEWS